jgi:hypothetical protein
MYMSYNSWKRNPYYLQALKVSEGDDQEGAADELRNISVELVADAIARDNIKSNEVWLTRDAIITMMEGVTLYTSEIQQPDSTQYNQPS